WPHMSVFDNVAYALRVRHLPKTEIEERVVRILELVGIGHLRDEFSSQLSGGQQQRIALARSLVADPEVILFDEPLSNVDAKVREELRLELLTMQKRIGFAGVYVTHDQEEAMAIADRIVVMRDGQVVQVGSPSEVYEAPQSRFVASFIGVVNELLGVVEGEAADSTCQVVVTDLGEVVVAKANMPAGAGSGDQVAVLMRPEALSVMAATDVEPDRPNAWPGTLQTAMFRGAYKDHLVTVGSRLLRSRGNSYLSSAADTAHDKPIADGDPVVVVASPRSIRAIAVGVEAGSEDVGETAPLDGTRAGDRGNG
ncbi:MAG: ABC transporter ATP-binding protein, partial [Acidimicrobiia bacterium]